MKLSANVRRQPTHRAARVIDTNQRKARDARLVNHRGDRAARRGLREFVVTIVLLPLNGDEQRPRKHLAGVGADRVDGELRRRRSCTIHFCDHF